MIANPGMLDGPGMTPFLHLGPISCEEDWQASASPEQMISFLGEQGSQRRWQLFACACCWRILPLLVDERSRRAVSVAERQAEGLAEANEIAEAQAEAHTAMLELWSLGQTSRLAWSATAAHAALTFPRRTCAYVVRAVGGGEHVEQSAQCRLLRELFGNPFRLIAIEPKWRTTTVLTLASHIYEKEAFTDMPVLGDALEDAGCEEQRVLQHCRAEEGHLRGCWVVDAILQKV